MEYLVGVLVQPILNAPVIELLIILQNCPLLRTPSSPLRFEHHVAIFFDGFLKKCVREGVKKKDGKKAVRLTAWVDPPSPSPEAVRKM